MSQLSFSSFDGALLVRNAQGRYLPGSVDQILEAARQAIKLKMKHGAKFTSQALVKAFLRNKLIAVNVKKISMHDLFYGIRIFIQLR